MKLRHCANIDLKTINIGENMKTEIIEALALELTKSKLSNKQPTALDLVQVFTESLNEIRNYVKEIEPKREAKSRKIKGMAP